MFEEILKSKPHNVHHLNRYIKFIKHYSDQTLESKYIERHHICPKANDLFPEYQSFKKHPWNKINLSLKQHYIAHLLLAKAYGGSQAYAVLKMYRKRKSGDKFNSRIYETLRKEEIEFNRSVNQGDNHWSRKPGQIHNAKVNHPKGMKNKKHSDEYKTYMKQINTGDSNPFYGKTHSDQTKQKLSQKTSQQRWFTNGVDNIKIIDVNYSPPPGWRIGRTMKNPQQGKKWIHNNDQEILINQNESIPPGWSIGKANRIFINNGIEMKMIRLSESIPTGWYVGRVKKHTRQ